MPSGSRPPHARELAVLVSLAGDPARLDDRALATFWTMTLEAGAREGAAGAHLLAADRARGTVLAVFLVTTPAGLDVAATRAAIDVAAVLIGADPGTASVEVLEVVGLATEPAHYERGA